MYQLSLHAIRRIKERNLRVEWLLAALDGREARQADGNLFLVDPASRCALVINPRSRTVITALRLRPSRYKRLFSQRGKRKSYSRHS